MAKRKPAGLSVAIVIGKPKKAAAGVPKAALPKIPGVKKPSRKRV